VLALLAHDAKRTSLETNCKAMAKPEAARTIAREILTLIEQ